MVSGGSGFAPAIAALTFLADSGQAHNARDIAVRAGVSTSAVPYGMGKLEAAGLIQVEQDPGDASILYRITAEGRRLLPAIVGGDGPHGHRCAGCKCLIEGNNLYVTAHGRRRCRNCWEKETRRRTCDQGHALTEENVRVGPSGRRTCAACYQARRGLALWPEVLDADAVEATAGRYRELREAGQVAAPVIAAESGMTLMLVYEQIREARNRGLLPLRGW